MANVSMYSVSIMTCSLSITTWKI